MCSERKNFAYIRAANKEGSEKTITEQRNRIRHYREQHPELPNHFEEIIDLGYSGFDDNAPGFQKILQLTEQDKVDTIIISNLSRLTRDYRKAQYYMETVFPTHKVYLVIVEFDSKNYSEKIRNK